MRKTYSAAVLRLVVVLACAGLFAGVGCKKRDKPAGGNAGQAPVVALNDARRGFVTHLLATQPTTRQASAAPDAPSPGVYALIHYSSPAGPLAAYLTPAPADGKKRPAVVWCHGGFDGISAYYLSPQPAANDQTPKAFLDAGCVVMLPSWRGENDNPGRFEMFYGEVDDALAAVDYVSKLPYVDPRRVYIAGHSTGGTIALLAAEASDTLRAAFSFGGTPDLGRVVADGRGWDNTPFDYRDLNEVGLRSPGNFVGALKTPTFYFEGSQSPYVPDAIAMAEFAARTGAPFNAFVVQGGNHFNILRPLTGLVAEKIKADTGPACNILISGDEVTAAVARQAAVRPTTAPAGLVTLTPAALAEVRSGFAAKQLDPATSFLRLRVDVEGFSLDFDRAAGEDDLESDVEGVRVLLDKQSAARTGPFTVDYIQQRDGRQRFVMKENAPPTTRPTTRP